MRNIVENDRLDLFIKVFIGAFIGLPTIFGGIVLVGTLLKWICTAPPIIGIPIGLTLAALVIAALAVTNYWDDYDCW
jgi:hypothetical protein